MNYSSLLSRQSVLILGTGTGRFSVRAEDRHMAASEEKSILIYQCYTVDPYYTLTKIHSSRPLSTLIQLCHIHYNHGSYSGAHTQTTLTIYVENR